MAAAATKKPSRSKKTRPFALVLHANCPYVLGHDDWPFGIDPLCSAVAESYIPLLNTVTRLVADGISPQLTLSISPVLCEMLTDLTFQQQFQSYLAERIDTAKLNQQEFATQGLDSRRDLALFWETWYTNIERDFEKFDYDIIGSFRDLQNQEHIELLATPATHGHLPHFGPFEAVRGQVGIGIEMYKKHFGRQPRGMALAPGSLAAWRKPQANLLEFLVESGIEYAVTNIQTTLASEFSISDARLHRLAAVRDQATSLLHLEDDTPAEPATSILDEASNYYLDQKKYHYPGALRLWRRTESTTDLAIKQLYEPLRSAESCETHAASFLDTVRDSLGDSSHGILCAALPAESLGQLWFEGPNWLLRLLRKLNQKPAVACCTLSDYARQAAKTAPAPGAATADDEEPEIEWPDSDSAWMQLRIQECQHAMVELMEQHGNTKNPKLQQILQQCGRELLLMESIDWQTTPSHTTAGEYAALRCAEHISVFQHIAALAKKVGASEFLSEGERRFLHAALQRDRCFDELSPHWWQRTG